MEVISKIGVGGFGIVELVTDGVERYARKTFAVNQPVGFSDGLAENAKRRFIREAKVQYEIKHDNIMPVLGLGTEQDPPYFLMPVAASTLAQDIDDDKEISGKALDAITDILAGLEELHSLGMTHRDLKPMNVLRLESEEGSKYVLSDFGFISIRDTQLSVLTNTGMRLGSDYYTAPEIVKDLKRADSSSDIYSVGCILHDIFGTKDRIPCSEINDNCRFGDIISVCTRQDPSRRFKTVSALRDAILSEQHASFSTNEPLLVNYLEQLQSDNKINHNIWQNIVSYACDHFGSDDARTLFQALSLPKIEEIVTALPDDASALGVVYSQWIQNGTFAFSECDGLANRLKCFFNLTDISCRSEILLALLKMGTSHNRWYVEKMFMELASQSLDLNTARRLSIEMRVDGEATCSLFNHLEYSIDADLSRLHPTVHDTYLELCQ